MIIRLRQRKRLLKSWKKIWLKFLEILWVVSLIISLFDYFCEIPQVSLKYMLIGLFVLFIISILICWPKVSYDYQLNDKEIKIRIKIWDITKADNIVVPINNQFIVTQHIKKAKSSVLKSIIEKYFNWDMDYLNEKLKESSSWKIWQIWKIVQIKHDNWKIFYFLSNTKLNNNGRSFSTETDLYDSIKWLFDYGNVDACDGLAIPILNSWHWNINKLNRRDIIMDIIEIFITMSQEKNVCKNLEIYIYPDDIENFKMDIDELNTYIWLNIKYWRNTKWNNKPSGELVDVSDEEFNELFKLYEKKLHDI